jgi:hypothetical protein
MKANNITRFKLLDLSGSYFQAAVFWRCTVCVPYKDDNPAELHIGVDNPRAFLHLLECEYPRDLALISQLLCTNFLEAPFQRIFLPWSITFLVSFYMLGNRALSSVMYGNCMKFL